MPQDTDLEASAQQIRGHGLSHGADADERHSHCGCLSFPGFRYEIRALLSPSQ
jgi:hypothetical protein